MINLLNYEENVFIKKQANCFNESFNNRNNKWCHFENNVLYFNAHLFNRNNISLPFTPTNKSQINHNTLRYIPKQYLHKLGSSRYNDLIIYLTDNLKRLLISYPSNSDNEIIITKEISFKHRPDAIFPHTVFDLFSLLYFDGNVKEASSFIHQFSLTSPPINYIQQPTPTYGIGRWQDVYSCLNNDLFKQSGVPCGAAIKDQYNTNYPLYYSQEQHMVTIAPNGSGKGSCVQIPALLEYDGSMFVIDPKGENAAVTAKYRKEKLSHTVFILNPFGVLKNTFKELGLSKKTDTFESSGFNPLSSLDPDNPLFVSDVLSLCDILVDSQKTTTSDPFWNESARDLIACITMFVCLTEAPGSKKRNLSEVRKILSLPEKELLILFSHIAGIDIDDVTNKVKGVINDLDNDTNYDDENFITTEDEDELNDSDHVKKAKSIDFLPLKQKAGLFTESSKIISSIITIALTNTTFLDDPNLAHNLSQDDIDFTKLKKEKTTIYLILPAHLLLTYSKWFKLLVNSALNQIMSTSEQGDKKVLMLLDECSILGKLQSLETAISLARGYGLQIWTFWQDIHQLINIYGDRYESFLANSGVHQYFTPNDMTLANKISQRLGKTTVQSNGSSNANSFNPVTRIINSSSYSENRSDVSVDFFPPSDLFSLRQDQQILFVYGSKDGILAEKIAYYKNEKLNNRASKNPYIKDKSSY